MAEQTAVEYLFKQYKLTGDISNSQWDKARRMQKEQTVDAYRHGQKNEFSHVMVGKILITGEEYYEQTFTTQAHDEQQS